MEVLEFIKKYRSIYGIYKPYSAGCYKFSLLLLTLFDGEMYWSSDHIITKIDGVFYDIHGIVDDADNFFIVGGETCSHEFVQEAYAEFMPNILKSEDV